MPSLLLQPRLWWTLLIVWVTVLFWLSSRPGAPNELHIPHFDKVLHAGYFGLGGLIFQTALRLPATRLSARSMILAGVALAALVGMTDEFHQTFTPGRSGNDPFDLCADVFGGLMAGLIAPTLASWCRRQR